MNVDLGQIEQDTSFQNWQRVRNILYLMLREWKIILVCVLLTLAWTAYKVRTAPRVYLVQMILTPAQTTGEDTTAARLNGALGNLAAFAGVGNAANQSASQFRLYVDSLQSRDLGNDLARNSSLMHTIFRAEWDEKNQRWHAPRQALTARLIQGVELMLGYPRRAWQPPDGARMQSYLLNAVRIDQDIRKTYLVTVSVNSTNPAQAVDFLRKLSAAADNHLRQKALTRANDYIQYLSNKLDTVTIADHRAAIMISLSEQEKYEMVASSAAPFAAELFDSPSATTLPVSPRPARMYLMGLLEGLLAGGVLSFAWARWGAIVRRRFGR